MAKVVVAKISGIYMLITVGKIAAALGTGNVLRIGLHSFIENTFVIRKCAKFL